MKTDIPELIFTSRDNYRAWLYENAETSDGVWLIFGKTKEVITITAEEALHEALCFGWIDGQMKSIDNTRYRKYFACRREKSIWSEKNKKIVETLREKNLMTELGEKAIETAKRNGTWNNQKPAPITDEQVQILAEKLKATSQAYTNFNNMPPSVRIVYTKRYFSFKSEEARQRDFEKIVDRLNKNLNPM